MQKKLKGLCKGDFEFCSMRNGTRIITKEMADYSAIHSYLETHKLPYFTFFPKSQKPIKAVICHLPHNTPAEDISDGLVNLGFDIISVKQMTTTHRSSTDGQTSINLPLYLITLPRTLKSQDIFQIRSLWHIAIKVEAYKAQTSLTQCYNCQKFGHVWANCKQPPRCLWCGDGHLHKECPEKGNASSKLACCNCKLGGRRATTPPTTEDAVVNTLYSVFISNLTSEHKPSNESTATEITSHKMKTKLIIKPADLHKNSVLLSITNTICSFTYISTYNE
jgi:hypothetical protein